MSVIEIRNMTKEFQLGQLVNLKDNFFNFLARIRGKEIPFHRKRFKAIDSIDLKISKGEVVGIIGTNGAGKSTLLKIISGITTPTTGKVLINGRIAPLIEVGAGLVPDLTGRENIYINGSILGIPRSEIKKKTNEIIEFAELEQFIDTPIKRYSSGMTIRIGFAIATSVDADILIVDEVLAVGDLAFQRKCFDRIENLIKDKNKTVLLVSHNIRQVERLCSRVILLDHGKVLADGKPEDVTTLFYKRSNEKIQKNSRKLLEANSRIKSSGEVELLSVELIDSDGDIVDEIRSGDELRVRIRFEFKCDIEKPEIVVGTHSTDFVYLTASSTAVLKERPDFPAGQYEIEYILKSFPFVSGAYCVRFAVVDQYRRVVFHGETLKMFNVSTLEDESKQSELRMVNLPAEWKLNGCSYG